MRGLNLTLELEHQNGSEHKFGALSQPGIVSIPLEEREQYLPQGEQQNIGEEKYWCASASPLNSLAALFTYHYQHNMLLENKKWLRDNGYTNYDRVDFSDAFVAINSGTTRGGNSLIAPLRAICGEVVGKGLIPKHILPQLPGFDETYDPSRITLAMYDLGAEFKRRFTIRYEQVQNLHIANVLADDMVGVALYAWPQPVNGIYPKTDNGFNHAVMLYEPRYYAFDNYVEGEGDYIKALAPDYELFQYGYRIYLAAENPNATAEQLALYQKVIPLLKQWLALLLQKVGSIIN
jgi:hypothetical protein